MKSKMAKTRVLHVITALGEGGAEAVLYRLCQQTIRECDHIVISLTNRGKYAQYLEKLGVKVQDLRMRSFFSAFLGFFRLIRLIGIYRPHCVQTWLYHGDLIGGIAARFCGVRRVYWGVHNSTLKKGSSSRNTILIRKLLALLSWIVPQKIIFCSNTAKNIHLFLGYTNSNFCLIPNGCDTELFHPDERTRLKTRENIGIGKDDFLCGVVARNDPQKDHENLFQALRLLKSDGHNIRCVLVGERVDLLAKKVEHFGLVDQVTILGSTDNVQAVMSSIDVLILPSLYGEAFPNVLLEAMSCGTPCIATNVGDVKEIIGNTGVVIPAGDYKSLAQAVMLLKKMKNKNVLWGKMQRECRNRICKHFTIEKMASRYLQVWSMNE